MCLQIATLSKIAIWIEDLRVLKYLYNFIDKEIWFFWNPEIDARLLL